MAQEQPPAPAHAREAPATNDAGREFNFEATYTANLPRILGGLNISLALTSYQANRLILIRSNGESIDTSFRAFPRPMGLCVERNRLVLGIWSEVLDYRRVAGPRSAAPRADETPAAIDAPFYPRASHVTGMINVHDIAWGKGGLWLVNSAFSCLATLHPDHSFVPQWKPWFISDLVPEDRCHLNGMAMKDGEPAFVTTFCQADTEDGWRKSPDFDGTLIDVKRNRILVEGLAMPHSPRYYRDRLYYCESGEGRLCVLDPKTGENRVLIEFPGFPRGVAFFGPLMFVGLSRTRSTESKKVAPIARRCASSESGVWVINLDDNEVIARYTFEGDVSQIYDVGVFPNARFPDVVEWNSQPVREMFQFPQLPREARAANAP